MEKRRDQSPPASVEQALRRSAMHARNAIAEASLATIALLDAISIPLTGHHAAGAEPSDGLAGRGLATLARRLGELATQVRRADTPLPDELLAGILAALDAEITRWEARSREDPDARAVLRAFLGLREILWEFGVRGRSADMTAPGSGSGGEHGSKDPGDVDVHDENRSDVGETRSPSRQDARNRTRRPRVQRIRVDD